MPPAEFAHEGVYCTGPECHNLQPKWERPISEVQPPKTGVKNAWPGYTEKPDFGMPVEPIRFVPAESLTADNGAKPASANTKKSSPPAPPRKADKKPVKKGAR